MQKFRLLYLNLQLQDRELWAGCWYTLLPCVSKTMFLCFFIFLIQFRFFPRPCLCFYLTSAQSNPWLSQNTKILVIKELNAMLLKYIEI